MTIPNTTSLDPGTYEKDECLLDVQQLKVHLWNQSIFLWNAYLHLYTQKKEQHECTAKDKKNKKVKLNF